MSFGDWVHESKCEVREFGVGGVKGSLSKFVVGGAKRLGQRVNYGRSQFDEDWDVLVLLDSCRPDYLASLHRENQYEWIESIDTRYSPGSSSIEWIQKSLIPLDDSEKAGLAIVSGNGWTDRAIDKSQYHSVETLLSEYWDDERGLMPPEVVTEYAVRKWRDESPDKMLVWYMQPHTPHPSINLEYEFSSDMGEVTDDWTETEYARVGALSTEELRAGYRDTLELGLQEVGRLVENLSADTVYLSADHAELLGEWGLYEHPRWAPIPTLKRVPWVEINAGDSRAQRDRDVEGYENTGDLDDRLSALGYKA